MVKKKIKEPWETHRKKVFCPLIKKNCIYDKCVGFTLIEPIKESSKNDAKVIGMNRGCRLFNNKNIEITLFDFKGKIVE